MDRVVVVTGASGRIGRAVVEQFAARGDAVALLARDRERLDELAAGLVEHGVRTLVLPTDVADPDAVEVAVARVEEELGPVDVLVTAASVPGTGSFDESTPQDFLRVTEVGYLGVVHTTMAVLDRMRDRGRGVVLHVGSSLAYRGSAFRTALSGAQHAVQGFTEALRTELAEEGIPVRVTMVHVPADEDVAQAGRVVARAADGASVSVEAPRP